MPSVYPPDQRTPEALAAAPAESFGRRLRRNAGQLVTFGAVGGSGVLVNLVAIIVCKHIYPHYEHIVVALPVGGFNVRWYHVFAVVGFTVSNAWNFLVNRLWTFRRVKHQHWLRGFAKFFAIGAGAFVISLGIQTLLINPTSPIALPKDVFDDSTGFRTRLYWAILIGTLVATPVNFVVNKLLVFRGRK